MIMRALILLLTLLALAGCGGRAPAPLATGAQVPVLRVATLAGDSVNLLGTPGQATWVSFWASWCAPCREEWPTLNAAVRTFGPAVRIVAVSVNEPQASVAGFVAEHPADFVVAVDPEGALAGRFGVVGFPTHFLIDGDGVVRQVVRGPLDGARAASLLAIADAKEYVP